MARDKCIIQCRLRAGKDDDLRKAISELPVSRDRSDLIRDALRLYFFRKKKEKIPVPDYLPNHDDKKEEPDHLQKLNYPHDVVGSKLDSLLDHF